MTNPLRSAADTRLPRVAGPCAIVLFGVTGDLARKKVMPAIYDLAARGLLPPGFALVGFARRDWEDQDFAQTVREAVAEHSRTGFDPATWERLAEGIRFVAGDASDPEAYRRLGDAISTLDAERGTGGNHAFYLSIPPSVFPTVLTQLQESGLAEPPHPQAWRRVVIEKPFGHDLASAEELDQLVETSSRPNRCSASIITSARRRCRTSSRCVSRTPCSSRCGTAISSTTSRSPWPRTSVSVAAPVTTTASVPPATSCRTICCNCSR